MSEPMDSAKGRGGQDCGSNLAMVGAKLGCMAMRKVGGLLDNNTVVLDMGVGAQRNETHNAP